MVIAAAVLISGMGAVLAINTERPDLTARQLFDNGMVEFQASNYGAASDLFARSYQGFLRSGNDDAASEAQNMKFRCDRVLFEYSLTRSRRRSSCRYLHLGPGERAQLWLNSSSIEKII